MQQYCSKFLHKVIVLQVLNKKSEEIHLFNHLLINELIILATQGMKYLVEYELWRERIPVLFFDVLLVAGGVLGT